MSLLTSAVSMTKAMVQIDSTDPGTYEKAMADWIEQQLSDLSNVLITRENCFAGTSESDGGNSRAPSIFRPWL